MDFERPFCFIRCSVLQTGFLFGVVDVEAGCVSFSVYSVD